MRFWSLVVSRTFRETAELLGLRSVRRLSFTIASFLIAMLVLGLIPGGGSQIGEEVRWAIALVAAAGIVFIPVFLAKLVTVPAALYVEQHQLISSLQTGDISVLVDRLEREEIETEGGDRETHAYILAGELADDLATSGVVIPEQGTYRGLRPHKLTRFLADMVVYGIVEPVHRTVERDRGFPYTETDYFLTRLGAEIVARIHKRWEVECEGENV